MHIDVAPVAGQVGPLPDGLDRPYWEGLRNERLTLQRCTGCEEWIWGPQWSCPACLRLDPAWEDTEARGTIFSWTRTWQAFSPEFRDHLPYLTALVQLPQAGNRRVLGILLGDSETDPAIGEPVVGVFQQPLGVTDGTTVLRWARP